MVMARLGWARWAGHGPAWQGYGLARRGKAWHGRAWRG